MAVSRSTGILALILLAYLFLGWLYATRVPKWNAPDEPAHFNYVKHVATTGTLPVLQVGDYDVREVERRMAAKFADGLPVDWMRYESHQPPLYYVLAAPVYLLAQGRPIAEQVVALRLLSTALGAVGLVVAYMLVCQIFPKDQLLCLAVPGIMAFVPMRVAMYAAVENDALAELVLTTVVLALVLGLRRRTTATYDLVVGALLGVALLTKLVSYTALALVVVAFAMAELLPSPLGENRSARGRLRRLARRLAIAYGAAILLSGWWFVRNALVYGGLDVFGMKRHDLVVAGQPLTGALTLTAIQHFVVTAFRSFWAQFGWMGIVVDERIYALLAALCGLAALGLLVFAVRLTLAPGALSPFQWRALTLLVLWATLVSAGVVGYNLTYLQAQGRYFFPALPALALLGALGLRELMAREHAHLLMGLLSAGLFGLTLLCLFRFVVPAF